MKKILFSTIAFVLLFSLTQAQPPTPPGSPEAVPVDGGLALLAAAGAALGVQKVWNARKGKKAA